MENKYLQKIAVFLFYTTFVFLLLSPAVLYSGGTTHQISITVPGFPGPKFATVYLPEGYDPNGPASYRVVYFLHGVNNTHNSPNYNPIYGVIDQLIANNLIEPVILVRPDGSAPPYLGSFYTNSALYGPCEDWIYDYLVDYIDSNYKVKSGRNNRVIFGHSMGGYGSMKMAFKHPELYRAAASLAGPLEFTILLGLAPYLIAETGQQAPPYNFKPTNGLFSIYAFSLCGAFTPNLSNPPYMVDFLLTTSGTPNWPAFLQTKTHCAARLSKNIGASDNLGIYFDCGLNDELGMLACNVAFKDTLTIRNIPYKYKFFAGANHWGLLFTDRIPAAMHFLDSVMNYPEDALNVVTTKIDGFDLEFGITTALKAKINSALNYWAVDDYAGVCSSVQAFINFVNAQKGKKISEAQAVILLNDANSIRFALDCGPGGDITEFENISLSKFALFQNYPNPFNPITLIDYSVPKTARVNLNVYDITGRKVATLVDEIKSAGNYRYSFDASNLAAGVYLYTLKADGVSFTKKMVLIK